MPLGMLEDMRPSSSSCVAQRMVRRVVLAAVCLGLLATTGSAAFAQTGPPSSEPGESREAPGHLIVIARDAQGGRLPGRQAQGADPGQRMGAACGASDGLRERTQPSGWVL